MKCETQCRGLLAEGTLFILHVTVYWYQESPAKHLPASASPEKEARFTSPLGPREAAAAAAPPSATGGWAGGALEAGGAAGAGAAGAATGCSGAGDWGAGAVWAEGC